MDVATVYRTLWRHKLFIILLTSALAVAAYVITSGQEKEYTASSLVRIEQKVTQPSDLYGALITGERLARTYALIASTDSVRKLVRERLPASVPDDAINIDAAQVSNLEVLSLSVTYSDPVVAARVANAIPGALSEFVRTSGTPREIISTVETAGVPSSPSAPNLKLNVMIAILLGVILNSGLVLLIEAFSDRVGSVEELERATGQPVIAAIPPLRFVRTVPPGIAEDARRAAGHAPTHRQPAVADSAARSRGRVAQAPPPLPPERRLGGLGLPHE
jgi:capsular polysaccharide biosynthesis protein